LINPFLTKPNYIRIYGHRGARGDIVVIKRGIGLKAVFTIHNMTENKINYQLNDNDLPKLIDNDFNTYDFLTSTKYNCKNISLDPFQVIWLSAL